MSERPTKQWNIGTALLATVLGSLITVAGIGATFGGYKNKVDTHEIRLERVETNAASKVDVQRLDTKIEEIRLDVKDILKNSNTRRR